MMRFVRRPGCALAALCFAAFTSPLFAQTAAPAAQKPAAAAADLPSAQSNVDRHIKASGGAEVIKASKSQHAIGKLSVPANGMSGKMEIFSMRPNKVLVKQNIEGIGDVSEGFDGTVAWAMSAMTGPMLITGAALEQKKLDSDFDLSMNPALRYSAMKTLEKTTFDGREVYKLSMTRKEGGEDIAFYDVNTGLRAGAVVTREGPMGNMTVTSTVADYKKFGSMLIPTMLKQSVNGVDIVITLETIELDTVDPAVFALPAEVKALIK